MHTTPPIRTRIIDTPRHRPFRPAAFPPKFLGLQSLESRVLLDGAPFGIAAFTPLGDSPVIVAGPSGLNGAPLLDLNSDGMGDLIVEYGNGIGAGTSTVAAVSALLVNADGTSTEYRIARYAIPHSAPLPLISQVLVGDFNGDGQPDVAVLRNDGAALSSHKFIDIFMGQTNGTFTQSPSIDLGTSVALAPTMTLFDQNGDGKTDIFLEDTTKLTVYLGNGDGTFSAPVVTNFQTVLFPLSLNKLSSITNASFQQDLNGDGIPDLVVSGLIPSFVQSGNHHALYVFKGQASGSYNLTTPLFSDTSNNLTLLAMRQLSSDNKLDIVAYSSPFNSDATHPSSIFVFRNNGNGAFTQTFHSPTFADGLPDLGIGLNNAQPLLTPDLTHDGIADMVIVEGPGTSDHMVTLHILKNNGNAGFTETQAINFTSITYSSSSLIQDVDGDGLPDLVVFNFTGGGGQVTTTIYFNNGGGVFDSTGLVPQPSAAIPAGRYPGLADFNHDGKLDLIYTGSVVEVLLNTTGRAFGAPIVSNVSGTIVLSQDQDIPPDPLLDYTGDGVPDLVSYFGDDWNILASTGDGHFTTLEPPLTDGGLIVPTAVIPADFNNDGKTDLILGNVPALNQFDENTAGLFIEINGVTPPTDTAGNDTSTARDLGTLSGPLALTEFVDGNVNTPALSSPLDSNDFYKFTLASPATLSITAIAEIGQVGIALEDAGGTNLITSSTTPGVVEQALDAGTYYIDIQNSGPDTRYDLHIAFPTGAASIGVRQAFATILNNQTTAIDFGNVLVTTTDTHKVFTIQNTGLDVLNLGTISLPAGFVLDGASPPSTLAAGASASFSVMMDTSSAGNYSGTITIPSPDPLVNNFSFPVSGTVTGPSLSDLSGQFGNSPALPASMIPGQSAPLSFTLSNAGPGTAGGTYSLTFRLEKGAAQLGKGDIAAGSASGMISSLAASTTTVPLAGTFTVPGNLAAGTYFLAATITHGGGDVDTNTLDKTFFSGAITIGAPATHIAFVHQPSSTVAGQLLGPVSVELLDAGNHVVAVNANVTLALTIPGNATVGGTLTVPAVSGVATFNDLVLAVAGGYTFTATSGAITSPKSSPFTILPDASSARLVIAHQPADSTVGLGLTPPLVVNIEDAFGNVINTGSYSTSTVTLNVLTGPVLNFAGKSTLTAKAAKGVATFSKATLNAAGLYHLSLTDGLLPSLAFDQTILPGTTSAATPHVAASYTFGIVISLSTTFKTNVPSSIPFTGTPGIYDQNGQLLGTGTFRAGGTASFAFLTNSTGNFLCTLVYPGDANHAAFTSSAFTLAVHPAATKLTLAGLPTTLVSGQFLSLLAIVSPAAITTPTGNVKFYEDGNLLQTVAVDNHQSASWTFVPNGVGKHSYTAVYSGDGNFTTSTSAPLVRTVAKDKTALHLTLQAPATSPLPHNQTFNLDVHVTLIAPGSTSLAGDLVTIKDNGKLLGTVTLDAGGGGSLLGLMFATPGAHSLTAAFPGDADALASQAAALKLKVI